LEPLHLDLHVETQILIEGAEWLSSIRILVDGKTACERDALCWPPHS
jgi:hypothetical protein